MNYLKEEGRLPRVVRCDAVTENVLIKDIRSLLLVVFRINVDLAIFQPYLDLEAGDNQSLKIQVVRPGIEPRSSCSKDIWITLSSFHSDSIKGENRGFGVQQQISVIIEMILSFLKWHCMNFWRIDQNALNNTDIVHLECVRLCFFATDTTTLGFF